MSTHIPDEPRIHDFRTGSGHPKAPAPRAAVLYARVSSKEQESGYSIPAQQELLRQYADQLGLTIEREFTDAETAKDSGRHEFNAMMRYLAQHPACRIVLVEKTDRLYRNYKDYVLLGEMDLEIHFVKENEILSRDSGSSQKFMHEIRLAMAKNYTDNLSEEVKKGMRTKARQGYWPSYAPLGYRNTVGEDGKRIMVPDPVPGPMVTKLFEWFATGEYSLQRLSRFAFEMGFRFRKSDARIPVATLQKMLRKRIYTGEFDYAGVRYPGVYEPLVTREIWERVQEVLDGRRRQKHRKVTHDFAFSGMVSCGHCGCSLVGEKKKQRYVYYHCTGYRGKCGERYVSEETMGREFARALRELRFPAEILRWLEAALLEAESAAQAACAEALRRSQVELERLRQRQEVMYDDRLDGRIDPTTYDNRLAQIREQQAQIERRIRVAEVAQPCTPELAEDLSVLVTPSSGTVPATGGHRTANVVARIGRAGFVEEGCFAGYLPVAI
jgi:site-specific DNA recombinase